MVGNELESRGSLFGVATLKKRWAMLFKSFKAFLSIRNGENVLSKNTKLNPETFIVQIG